MFEQFRRYFPQGSLLSELVQVDHGKYIVRATIQNAGLTLATGLAAADTVEKAEDEARLRALAVLDIFPTATPSPEKPQAKDLNFSPPATSPPKPSIFPSVVEADSNHSPVTSEEETEKTTPSVSNSSDDSVSSSPTEKVTPPKTTPSVSNSSDDSVSSSPTEKVTPPKTTPSVSNSSDDSVSSSNREDQIMMDSSDIIARTNVELRRLNWTSEQGRKFLGETYGKRSRSLLSDAELLEFLEYLEKQPTPPQDSDQ